MDYWTYKIENRKYVRLFSSTNDDQEPRDNIFVIKTNGGNFYPIVAPILGYTVYFHSILSLWSLSSVVLRILFSKCTIETFENSMRYFWYCSFYPLYLSFKKYLSTNDNIENSILTRCHLFLRLVHLLMLTMNIFVELTNLFDSNVIIQHVFTKTITW